MSSNPTKWSLALAVILAAVAPACSASDAEGTNRSPAQASSGGPHLGAGPGYQAEIDTESFVDVIDNPLFPLEAGTVYRLRSQTEGAIEHEKITVTHRTREILGVATTVVKDVMRVNGQIAELTYDWYAQDRDGNVWYFGENTAEYEDGKVTSRKGSWESGVDGARPGIVMSAEPRVTDSFRQEYYPGEAEDMYWVVAVDESLSVAFGRFEHAVRTLEWTPLEPRIVVEKLYAPGVGLVAEKALSGPREDLELVDMVQP